MTVPDRHRSDLPALALPVARLYAGASFTPACTPSPLAPSGVGPSRFAGAARYITVFDLVTNRRLSAFGFGVLALPLRGTHNSTGGWRAPTFKPARRHYAYLPSRIPSNLIATNGLGAFRAGLALRWRYLLGSGRIHALRHRWFSLATSTISIWCSALWLKKSTRRLCCSQRRSARLSNAPSSPVPGQSVHLWSCNRRLQPDRRWPVPVLSDAKRGCCGLSRLRWRGRWR